MSMIRKRLETGFNTNWSSVMQCVKKKQTESDFMRIFGTSLREPAYRNGETID